MLCTLASQSTTTAINNNVIDDQIVAVENSKEKYINIHLDSKQFSIIVVGSVLCIIVCCMCYLCIVLYVCRKRMIKGSVKTQTIDDIPFPAHATFQSSFTPSNFDNIVPGKIIDSGIDKNIEYNTVDINDDESDVLPKYNSKSNHHFEDMEHLPPITVSVSEMKIVDNLQFCEHIDDENENLMNKKVHIQPILSCHSNITVLDEESENSNKSKSENEYFTGYDGENDTDDDDIEQMYNNPHCPNITLETPMNEMPVFRNMDNINNDESLEDSEIPNLPNSLSIDYIDEGIGSCASAVESDISTLM